MKFKKVQKEQFEGQICQKETEELEEKKKKKNNYQTFQFSLFIFRQQKILFIHKNKKSV